MRYLWILFGVGGCSVVVESDGKSGGSDTGDPTVITGVGDDDDDDDDNGTVTDTDTDTDTNTNTNVDGDCAPRIPANAEVHSDFWASVGNNEVMWLCSGADVSVSGSGGTFFLEDGATLQVSGSDVTVYARAGSEVNLGGELGVLVYEPGASIDASTTSTVQECDPLVFDTSIAPVPGCN